MVKLFKSKIPSGDTQEITLIKTYILEWTSYKYDFGRYSKEHFNIKSFINIDEAKKFKEQLIECSKFTNSYINIKDIRED